MIYSAAADLFVDCKWHVFHFCWVSLEFPVGFGCWCCCCCCCYSIFGFLSIRIYKWVLSPGKEFNKIVRVASLLSHAGNRWLSAAVPLRFPCGFHAVPLRFQPVVTLRCLQLLFHLSRRRFLQDSCRILAGFLQDSCRMLGMLGGGFFDAKWILLMNIEYSEYCGFERRRRSVWEILRDPDGGRSGFSFKDSVDIRQPWRRGSVRVGFGFRVVVCQTRADPSGSVLIELWRFESVRFELGSSWVRVWDYE